MCGIAGFIGLSKKPYLTNQLISKLFEYSDIRGIDAAGFWAAQAGSEGKIFYHKEPIRSSNFIHNSIWKDALKFNIDLMLVHARGASKGVGEPEQNQNNHPFTSNDKLISVIHNGRIDDQEYKSIKENFELFSDCDSEVILRIYEASGIDFNLEKRLLGIKNIFNLANKSHMAVAIGERIQEERNLWLFRNQHRPLWIADMTEHLGQIFFVSEPSIWFKSIEKCDFNTTQEIVELPTEEVWLIELSSNTTPNSIKKYKIDKELKYCNNNKNYCSIIEKNPICEIVTGLDMNDQILSSDQTFETLEQAKFLELEKQCDVLVDNIDSIRVILEERISDQLASKDDLDIAINVMKMQNETLERLISTL